MNRNVLERLSKLKTKKNTNQTRKHAVGKNQDASHLFTEERTSGIKIKNRTQKPNLVITEVSGLIHVGEKDTYKRHPNEDVQHRELPALVDIVLPLTRDLDTHPSKMSPETELERKKAKSIKAVKRKFAFPQREDKDRTMLAIVPEENSPIRELHSVPPASLLNVFSERHTPPTLEMKRKTKAMKAVNEYFVLSKDDIEAYTYASTLKKEQLHAIDRKIVFMLQNRLQLTPNHMEPNIIMYILSWNENERRIYHQLVNAFEQMQNISRDINKKQEELNVLSQSLSQITSTNHAIKKQYDKMNEELNTLWTNHGKFFSQSLALSKDKALPELKRILYVDYMRKFPTQHYNFILGYQ